MFVNNPPTPCINIGRYGVHSAGVDDKRNVSHGVRVEVKEKVKLLSACIREKPDKGEKGERGRGV